MADISVFQHRINYLIKNRFGGNNSKFSRITGVPESTIRTYLVGNYPKLDKIAEICETLNVSADWLILGRGEITQRDYMDLDTSVGNFANQSYKIYKSEANADTNENRLWTMIESQQRMLESQQRTIEELTKKGGAEGAQGVAKAARG